MTIKKAIASLLSIILILGMVTVLTSCETQHEWRPPFERYGRLSVIDGQLSDERGNPVQLRGMSTFGLHWTDGTWILTDEAFYALANDWKCDVIRLAMYIGEGGYATTPGRTLARVKQGIELATAHGMYVIVDWHVHNPGDPMHSLYLTAGLENTRMPEEFLALRDANPDWTGPQVFFAYIAKMYGHQGNILYETANEPNGLGSHADRHAVWSRYLKPYHESIIEVIRQFDPYGVIICGTDNWSQFVDAPVYDPIDDPNVMYALHFYAGTHDIGDDYFLRTMADTALDAGLALFVTEWGVSDASGDGGPYLEYAMHWLEFLDDRDISWTAWSLANKFETSAAFMARSSPTPDGAWPDEQITESGHFYRRKIRGD